MTARKRVGDAKKQKQSYERQKRIEETVRLYLKGKSVREIAGMNQVNIGVIYNDLKVARKIWRKRNDQAAEKLIAYEVAKIDEIERQAWEQWERSKKNAIERSQEIESDGTGKKRKSSKGQCGDPRYLDIALKCVDKRCRTMRIGEYSTEESGQLVGQLVEVVVDSPEEVETMMNYRDYQELTKPSAN